MKDPASTPPMPNRHPNHALDRTTVNAFERRVLEAGWIWRETPNDDYGSDGNVEIADDGQATGISFAVQLKGTAQADERAVRSIRLNMTTYNYLRVQSPALLARYDATTDRLWVRWLHTFDPYPREIDPNAQTISIPVGGNDLWIVTTPSALRAEVRRFREINAPLLVPPIRFAITASDDLRSASFHEPTVVHELESPLPGMFAVTDDAPVATVRLDESSISATLGSSSFTIHQPTGDPSSPTTVAADVAVTLAGALTLAGHGSHAVRLFSHYLATSSVVAHADVVMLATATYIATGAIADLALLASDLSAIPEVDDDLNPVDLVTAILGTLHGHLSAREKRQWVFLYLIPVASNSTDGSSAYNVGHHLFELGEYEAAYAFYEEAAQRDPTYKERDYYIQETTVLCYETGRLEEASAGCQSLFQQRDQPTDRVLYADVLLAQGRFVAAHSEFLAYESKCDFPDAHWIAKRIATEDIIALREGASLDCAARQDRHRSREVRR